MNSQDTKQLREALPIYLGKPKVTQLPDGPVRLDIPFETSSGSALSIIALHRTRKRKISLFAVPGLSSETNMLALQQLLKTYGLILTQEGTVAEESDRPLGKRMAALCQGLIAVDALARGLEVVNVRTSQRAIPEDPGVTG